LFPESRFSFAFPQKTVLLVDVIHIAQPLHKR
jgi:hypothetical protein